MPVSRSNRVTSLALFRTPETWRYAIYLTEGIVDGHISDVSPSDPEADAQESLLANVRANWTTGPLQVEWRQSEPNSWIGEITAFTCPVCGYPCLDEEPWRSGEKYDFPSDDICPSCGTQFGYEDMLPDPAERFERHLALRKNWIAEGRPWKHSGSRPTPSELGWDPSAEVL